MRAQARVLLGKTADEVAPLKEAPDPKPYEALLERAAWGEWLLRVQSRTQCAPFCPHADWLKSCPSALLNCSAPQASPALRRGVHTCRERCEARACCQLASATHMDMDRTAASLAAFEAVHEHDHMNSMPE